MSMSTGTVKFFNMSKGFGFITQDADAGKDLFFHVSELAGQTIDNGAKVDFDLGESPKGPTAVNVREAYDPMGR